MWFKVDDRFWCHPTIVGLSPRAGWLWLRAGCWSAQQNTAGNIPRAVLKFFRADDASIRELEESGLWEATENGWHFHEWRKHQDGDYRKNIPRPVRRDVFERDGYQCVFCGATDDLQLDHIIRYRDGGEDSVSNLRVLCGKCNRERG